MNTPSQGKRKLSNVSMDSKKQRRTSIAPKAVKTNINSSSNFMRSRTSRNNGKRCQTNSPTLIQNNRELATALNKAKSRVKELEDQRFELQGDRHRLMEKYSALTEQLQKMKDEHAVKQSIDNRIFKEVCELLRSKLQQATEKLLESSVFLAEVDQSVSALLKMSNLQDGENQNRSLELSLPLEITCDDSLQGSNEAALSITKLTPSPSSASSSDSCEMTSPDSSDNSLPNRAGLLTTIEDNNSTLEISDLRLVLTSTQTSTVREVLNASQESMDCHNNSRELDSTHVQPRSMDVDSPLPSSNEPSHTLCSTPDCSPIFCARGNPPHRLASTPEDREIPRYAANLTEDSPQLSPVFTLSAGRRTSRRRNTIDGFQGYKEPLLNSKLRQGDPFTDSSFFQTSQKNPSKKKKTK